MEQPGEPRRPRPKQRGPQQEQQQQQQQRQQKSPTSSNNNNDNNNNNNSNSPSSVRRRRSRQLPPLPSSSAGSAAAGGISSVRKKLEFSEEEESSDAPPRARARGPPGSQEPQQQQRLARDRGQVDIEDIDDSELEADQSPPPQERRPSRLPAPAAPARRDSSVAANKSRSRGSIGGGGGRPDSADLSRQIERLQRDLQRRDQELAEERTETERALGRIRKLERDKTELEQELEEVRDELNEYVIRLDELRKEEEESPPTPSGARRPASTRKLLASTSMGDESEAEQEVEEQVRELNDVVQQKNKEIEQLLEDLEKLETDKGQLHTKLADVRDSLADATTTIQQMTTESTELNTLLTNANDKIRQLEEDKEILEIKERDLLAFKERHEKYLENLCTAVDVRVDVWKKMMIEKDEEIDRLNIKIGALMEQIPNTQIDDEKVAIRQMKKKILDREEQINLLNGQLQQATLDIESYTKTIESLQEKLAYTENNSKMQRFVHSLESKLKKYSSALQEKSTVVHSYEKEIEERAREVSQLSSRLREYESGQYGLADAVNEIKIVKGQLRVRDKHIESLTQDVNQLQLQKQDVLDENELLRAKLGLGVGQDESSTGAGAAQKAALRKETAEFVSSRTAQIEKLQARIRHLENETVQLKSKNYGLRKEINELMKHQRVAGAGADEGQSSHRIRSHSSHVGKRRARSSSASPPSGSSSVRRRKTEGAAAGGAGGHGVTMEVDSHEYDDGDDRKLHRKRLEQGQGQGQRETSATTIMNIPLIEWKEKYEIILTENTELRKGLVEILDSMRRLSDEKTSNVLIESPILENLLREMSARGLINYPHPVSGFHLKVCNLEGKNSELREEIHRLRHEEKQLRLELLETKVQLQTAQDKLKATAKAYGGYDMSSSSGRESRSKSPRRQKQKLGVSFAPADDSSQIPGPEDDLQSQSQSEKILTKLELSAPQQIIQSELQTELQLLRDENNNLKLTHAAEKTHLESQLESLVQKGNEIIQLSSSSGGGTGSGEIILQRKFAFLKFLADVFKSENGRLLKRVAELENASNTKICFLQRFRSRALEQISQFQSALENSVPMSVLLSTKRQLVVMTKEWEQLQAKNDELLQNCMKLEKSNVELTEMRRLNEKYKKELEQARIVINSLAVSSTSTTSIQEQHGGRQEDGGAVKILKLESLIQQLSQKLASNEQELQTMTTQLETAEKSKQELSGRSAQLVSVIHQLESSEKELKFQLTTSIQLEDHENLQVELRKLQRNLTDAKDEMLKWKDLVELGQNQISALQNIKNFDKLELESLVSQICDLQAEELDKVELARVKREMVSCEKEKVLAEQELQKLQSKLSQLEILHFQQDKEHADREISLMAIHTQVIGRYRNLYTALYENYASATVCTPDGQLIPKSSLYSEQIHEAWELFNQCRGQVEELETELVETQNRADSFEEKCASLEEMLTKMRETQLGQQQQQSQGSGGGGGGGVNNNQGSGSNFEILERLQEAKLEVARWRRKAEHGDRRISSLVENLQRLEAKTTSLEEERIRYEHSLDLRDSLTQLLAIPSGADGVGEIKRAPGTTAMGPASPATATSSQLSSLVAGRSCINQLVQTEESLSDSHNAQLQINSLQGQVSQLEALLSAKDQVLSEFKVLHVEPPYKTAASMPSPRVGLNGGNAAELAEALQVAQDSIGNLQARLKVKEENISQYRKLLAEVRQEMTTSAERHVQEMKALQLTIYQQQQAFTRMKSTLSQPVKDSVNIEGATFRDQLNRINELEDEVSDLQHTLGNVASQLTSARSEANKWRGLADSRLRELDAAREHLTEETMEELRLLREKLRNQEELIREFRIIGPAAAASTSTSSTVRFSNEEIRRESESVQMLRAELAEKEKKLNTYSNMIQNLKKTGPKSAEKQSSEDLLAKDKDKGVHELKEVIRQLQQKNTQLTLKISKINAANQSSGISAELEELRSRLRELQEEKFKLQRKLDELQMRGHEDEEKRRKQIDSLARWDESKKWKKIVEKYESRIHELETETEKLTKTNQSLRLIVTRLEKEKHLVDSKLSHRARLTKSKESNLGGDETTTTTTTTIASGPGATITDSAIAPTIDHLKLETFELKEQLEKSEFESHEQLEKLKMEIRVLKERIASQERQIIAYQVASKGDPKIISEIEQLVKNEDTLQKQLLRLEEENLHLNLQMEQLKMDTPRLRDRVQHLQRLVDVLKIEKPLQQHSAAVSSTSRDKFGGSTSSLVFKSTTNQKSLTELERTITALKGVIDKLQTENKKLKIRPTPMPTNVSGGGGGIVARLKASARPPGSAGSASRSSENLKSSLASLLDEKQLLLDQLHELDHEKQKYHQMYLDAISTIDHLQISLVDSEKKAKSAEMKLKTFLKSMTASSGAAAAAERDGGDEPGSGPVAVASSSRHSIQEINTTTTTITGVEPSGNEKMFHYMREMQDKLERKEKLLAEAKEALKEAAIASSATAAAEPRPERV